MFRSALAAALRHLVRNRHYAAISVFGLAIGLCAALLAALVIRNQLTWDHFIAGHARIYSAMSVVTPPGRATIYMPNTSNFIGPQLKLRFPGIEAVTRLAAQPATLSRASLSVREQIYWADANAFDVLPMPVVAGDPRAALRRPDSLVLTRGMARKYFGSDVPLGETLLLDGHAMSIGAVIEDLPPSATHLSSGVFAPGIASWSFLQAQDAVSGKGAPVGFGVNTYLRLAPGASVRHLRAAAPAMVRELFASPPQGWKVQLELTRLDRIDAHPGLNPSFAGRLAGTGLLGVVILIIAAVNFVNLLTARAARRAVEVGIRKLAGASRRALVAQFLGESLLYVVLSALLAVVLTEWLLPQVNAFMSAGATFHYWRDLPLLGTIILAVVALGLVVGCWPALVLTSLRPLDAIRSRAAARRGNVVRQGLVTLQFTMLIALIIAAGVVYAQRRFATGEALRVDTDQVLILRAQCGPALLDGLRALPGVRQLGCSSGGMLNEATFMTVPDRQGTTQFMFYVPLQPDTFRVYGVRAVVGELGRGGAGQAPAYVINETAARRLGFARPADALGFALPSLGRGPAKTLAVIGVVPDFALASVEQKVEALGYITTAADPDFSVISLKLTGREIPETLAAIDQLWSRSGNGQPLNRYFVSEYLQRLYVSMLREAQACGVFSLVAVLLGALGLLGLSASIAERRTREIGIRKALGAQSADVTRLLLWEFARPVLWANLIAWPLAAWVMNGWLRGYAYHVNLPLWLFPAAGLAAVLIALATVSAHSLRVAAAKPVVALRHE